MEIRCVWEHNGEDTLLYAIDFPGAYTRGASLKAAVKKMVPEIQSYAAWAFLEPVPVGKIRIVQDSACELQVRDADSDVLFQEEAEPLSLGEYLDLKARVLKSAGDFLRLYEAIPDPNLPLGAARKSFYGQVPSTAREIYLHTRNVNDYYFGEIGVEADHDGTILECRQRGFGQLEAQENYLANPVTEGSYGEYWTARKVLRRFLWHDRIHARAMYRRAASIWGPDVIPDIFGFSRPV